MLEIGATADINFTADALATATALGSGDMPILGTPKVVALCEEAAVKSVANFLDEGSTTVGTHISIDHVAPTPVGSSVVATAVVIAVDGRTIEFEVSVSELDLIVARGTHTRVIVARERFLERLASR